ncbi:MAG: hypothetical protein KAT09_02775 [Candidatus Aegiribacteria sp.]|nr:hypothetical protein [Candidatus Aegiribacteria sp.]
MRTSIFLFVLLLPALTLAVSVDGWMDVQTGGDSLSPQMGRLDLGGLLKGGSWGLVVHQRFSHEDSTGVVPRILNSYSRTDVDFAIEVGPVSINPDVCWTVDIGDKKPEIVLPLQAGVANRDGFIRPGLGIEADVSEDIHLFARGLYWNRDLRQEDDYDLAWTETRISGGLTWDSPWGPSLTVAGLNHRTSSDFINYEATWSRIDASVAVQPQLLPANMFVSGDVTYSVYDGSDFNDHTIADRLTSRVRLVQMVIPSVSVNTTFESVIDFDEGVTRSACTLAESRIVYRFMRSNDIASSIVIFGKLSRSSIRTERVGIFSRTNLYRGLSILFDAEARVTPTSVAGAGPDRKRYVFGPGLEYQFGNTARIWGIVEQERTNLATNQNWWRLRAGLEFYPGSFNF